MDGKEVELPDMKVEGSLAVAELTKKHVDEFIPFILTIQEETTVRLRVNALTQVLFSEEVSDDQYSAVKVVLKVYDIVPSNDKEKLNKQCVDLFNTLTKELAECSKKTIKVSVITNPFFLERSLLEAYYMCKAYVWDEAKKINEKPKMPFTLEELKMLIDDPELAVFTRYSMTKIKKQATEDVESTEPASPEELKKKLTNTPTT